ncbi:hypothetical protein Scep_000669 [Stephania cephalantha]|uniref:Alanine-glyoxylate aminotransferase n=1 Tax=Stephania cephalantha TaxID=152367 RepID=A0AAP0L6J7_9MAGN
MREKKENKNKLRYLLGESMGGAVAILLHKKHPKYGMERSWLRPCARKRKARSANTREKVIAEIKKSAKQGQMSGFDRTGSHFWGFEAHGVIPDIVTMAKGIGNGIPLGAVVTTPEIAQVLTHRSYFNTFGGNPLCTTAGHAALKVLEKEKLQENAFVVGSYLKERLTSLKEKYEIIGDVRGRGLMLGVELVTDRHLKTPAKTEILHVMEQMKDVGVLIGKGGFYGNVFRITPPLCFTKEDADLKPFVTTASLLRRPAKAEGDHVVLHFGESRAIPPPTTRAGAPRDTSTRAHRVVYLGCLGSVVHNSMSCTVSLELGFEVGGEWPDFYCAAAGEPTLSSTSATKIYTTPDIEEIASFMKGDDEDEV